MDKVQFLKALTKFSQEVTKDMILPVSLQKEDDGQQQFRAPEIHQMRLPDSRQAKKKAPYIIHQIVTGTDKQEDMRKTTSQTVVRSIFCVYCGDEEEGGLMLLALMERLRIALLQQVVIGGQFALDTKAGLETMCYPDDTAPYFSGEMVSTWRLPGIQREVRYDP